ncbi:hypothetical protein J4212_08420 [Candidatus Woesearchaeota archaeon]|nr:hypothetical protein [Candidatus Woesearchaeota archaeon]
MKKIMFFAIFAVMLVQLSSPAFAQENDDPAVFGLEIEKLLNLGSGFLAAGLFAVTAAAYRKKKNKRLLYVGAAFLIFSLKGFLTSIELFGLDVPWIDPAASLLNFAILLSFFFGIMRK